MRNSAFLLAGSSNGRTTGSGPVNLGSSPSPAALCKKCSFTLRFLYKTRSESVVDAIFKKTLLV